MTCYAPLKGFRTVDGVVFSELSRHDILGDIEIPCGQCIGCRLRRASDWTLRCMHEASIHEENCFVTLTYAPGNLPPHGSLDHRDFQLFMKRLRRKSGAVRFYMCGEYGDTSNRAHYHACLFGINFTDREPGGRSGSGQTFYLSSELAGLWKLGRASVQDLTRETAGYCARYIMKKQLGRTAKYEVTDEDGVIHELRPPYAAMSLKPGIGTRWFNSYKRDVFPMDGCVMNGAVLPVPRAYMKKARKMDIDTDMVEFQRQALAREHVADNSDERRRVRMAVKEAQVSNLHRKDV